jgi:hypothetical protein
VLWNFLKVQKLAGIIGNVDDVEKSTRLRELESKYDSSGFYISNNSFSIDTEVMRFGPEDPHIGGLSLEEVERLNIDIALEEELEKQ